MSSLSYTISGGKEEGRDTKQQCSNLQEAFLQFRKKKQQQSKIQQKIENSKRKHTDPNHAANLRKKFLDAVLSYVGVPYAKKYHPPESPTHHAPLFLDCCGLVRRVLRDLKEDLGFLIGPWNQAYMYDTLPTTLSGPEEMKPGDLVFISGIYFHPKSKRHSHDMVHVEVWLGDEEKTVGARWQRGAVQIHDSYKFISRSYHSMEYHFKSIDTWLMGECKSFCSEHAWLVKKYNPNKRSVFAIEQDEDASDKEDDEQGGCGGEDDRIQFLNYQLPLGSNDKDSQSDGRTKTEGAENVSKKRPGTSKQHGKSKHDGVSSKPPSRPITSHHSVAPAACRYFHSYIIQGRNGATLVDRVLNGWGWHKIEDKTSVAFTLKWSELKQNIDFHLFRQGDQLVNHFPNISLLTTKIGLLESLRQHKSRLLVLKLHLNQIIPETYRLDVPAEREEFFENYKEEEQWICKPTGANQGKGIFLVVNLQQLRDKLASDEQSCPVSRRPTPRIVQRYISQPLLLEGRKFDIRVYMLLIAAEKDQILAFYHHGYIRLSCLSYDSCSPDMIVHLTNQFVQKKHPSYEDVKEDTVWDFNRFQSYLSEHEGLPLDWVSTTLISQIKHIMLGCHHSVAHKLEHKMGYFELLGFDFMLDSTHHVWLIEVNINPAMQTNCDTLKQILPGLIEETLGMSVEVWSKSRRSKPIFPIEAQKSFVTVFPA